MVEQLMNMQVGELRHFSGQDAIDVNPIAYQMKHDTAFNCEIFSGRMNDVEGIFIRRLKDK